MMLLRYQTACPGKVSVSNKLSRLYFDTFLTSHLSEEEFGVVPPHESHVSGEQ